MRGRFRASVGSLNLFSCALPQRLQLELVRKRSLARKQPFTLRVAVHDKYSRRVVVQLSDDDRHGLRPRQLAPPLPPMSGDKLEPAAGQRRAMAGERKPYFFTLSVMSCIASSSRVLCGCLLSVCKSVIVSYTSSPPANTLTPVDITSCA